MAEPPVGTDASRGQVEPVVALPALAVLCIGLSLFAVVLQGVAVPAERDVAEPTLERVEDRLTSAGVAEPSRLSRAARSGSDDLDLNVTLEAAGKRWAAGPMPPPTAATARRSLGVRTAPGVVRRGVLRVAVWPSEGSG